MAQRADAQKVEGKRRRGRPRLQWEDCAERSRKNGRTTATDSRRLLIENAARE